MKLNLKQWMIHAALALLRGLVFLKRHNGSVLRAMVRPGASFGKFFVRSIGIPLFRFVFWIRRQIDRLLLPTRHRFIFFVSNRFVIHGAIIVIVVFTTFVNAHERSVRAETFGKESLFYTLLPETDTSIAVEVVSAGETTLREPHATSYMNDPALDPQAHIDFDIGLDHVTTLVGGSVISAPTIRENQASVAARTAVETYTITEGDTLGSIAEQYGLNLSSLLWANGLTFRSIIRPGKLLTIPPIDGVIYTVKSGDTLSKIAKTYQSDAEKIIAFNRLENSASITVGTKLIIPDGEPPTPPPVRQPASGVFAKPGTPRGSVTGSGTWVWPTDWRVITQYFKGSKHTGVDIDGDYTTRSYAAADGVIVFAGWKGGYGLCIEVDHGNGLKTRYGHHSKIFVSVGDVVTAGQAIGQTGTTGRSTGTHLHFEVIRKGTYLNPLEFVR